jgi:DnaJ-domain-containing protein 1
VDQIFDRFGNLLKSFMRDDESSEAANTSFSDPDLQNAWDELEDFLNTDKSADTSTNQSSNTRTRVPELPAELRKDYALLKTKPGAPLEEVAKSYKQLLRIHHPDRHATDPTAFAKATEETKTLTSAFRRIKEYAKTGDNR